MYLCKAVGRGDTQCRELQRPIAQREMSELRDEIIKEYEKALGENTKPIIVAEVTYQYKDETEPHNGMIALVSQDEIEEAGYSDDDILFYADGMKEFMELAEEDNGEDFWILSIEGFYSEDTMPY